MIDASKNDLVFRLIAETLEEAGMSGLCLEGRIDLAVDRLRRAYPAIDDAAARATVHAMVERNGRETT